ncbi:MAG: sigma-70 family RNA polymerase sigma factor [Ferruginibacter sp.]|nr:sigma-70 family RNA polymerase sigma factor [Ferruginibacter sp.]
MTDNDVIYYLKQNDYEKALSTLYKNFNPVKKYVLANSGTTEDAEDIFQDTLVILYKKTKDSSFQLNSALATYLMGIAKNLWHQELRRKSKLTGIPITNDAIEPMIDEIGNYKNAEVAFNLLGERCKQLLMLFYYNKKSFRDIAKL